MKPDTLKELIVHIGTHKTGTTSFQASLRGQPPGVARQGFQPISAPKRVRGLIAPERYNVGRFAQSFLRPGVATVARLRRNFAARAAGPATSNGSGRRSSSGSGAPRRRA